MITSSQMTDEDSRKLFDKYESVLLADGGEVIKKDSWGTKKLAYPIKKQFRGQYVHYDIVAKAENLTEAERLMRIDDHVLRYLSVRIGENVDVATRKAEIAKAEAARADMAARREDGDEA